MGVLTERAGKAVGDETHVFVYADEGAKNLGKHDRVSLSPGKAASRWDSFQSTVRKLAADLDVPVHTSTIAIYRMLYAFCVLAQLMKWDRVFTKFATASSVYPYPAYAWVKPLDPAGGARLLSVCWWSSICQLLGLATPVATCVAGLSFTWLFLICESNFNNHYVLMCHMLFLGTFLQWGRSLSLDRLIAKSAGWNYEPFAPYWNLLLLRIIVTIPYFYGGIAKLNSDWLFRSQPVTMWFEEYEGWPYDQPIFAVFISVTGCLFDLVQPFLLFNRKTRYILAFPGAVMFNVGNKIMFGIGVFPMMMLCSLTLFLEPYIPAQVCDWVMRTAQKVTIAQPGSPSRKYVSPKEASEAAVKQWREAEKSPESRSSVLPYGLSFRKWFGILFVSGFLAFHCIYPLRHFVLYPGNPSWHEEGHNGAWHMKLRTKEGKVDLILTDSFGDVHRVDFSKDPFLYPRQQKMSDKPHAIILYVGRLKQIFEAAGNPLKSVTCADCYALNRREYHELCVRGVNLLDFVGTYELLGVSAAKHPPGHPEKWLYRDEEGPLCSLEEDDEFQWRREKHYKDKMRAYMVEAYKQGGIVQMSNSEAKEKIPNFARDFARRGANSLRPVVRINKDGEFVEYAYMWDNLL